MRDARSAGFTLLEVLVALVVLGFLMIGLTQGVRFGANSWARQTRMMDQRADLDAVDRVLRRLIEQMDPGAPTQPPPLTGDHAGFAFTSVLPYAALLRTREADMLLSVNAAHELVLRWTPHLHAIRLAAAAPPTDTVLLTGVDHMECAYWPPAGGAWVNVWSGRVVPALIRIRIAFPAGDVRHWPDIVAAPQRTQP
jgi:general secretion pathway protein J